MIDTIILDDGLEYVIVKQLTIDDIEYTLFANVNDPEDICFRKTVEKDGEEYFTGLDNEKEVDLILSKFSKYLLENLDELN